MDEGSPCLSALDAHGEVLLTQRHVAGLIGSAPAMLALRV